MRFQALLKFFCAVSGMVMSHAVAKEWYVSPSGSDENSGSVAQPFQTLAHAQAQARESGLLGKQPVTVFLREGIYYIDETLVLTADDSGSADAPVTFAAYPGEAVVISGGLELDLNWQPYQDGIYQADTPAGLKVDQLFIEGQRQRMARYPNYNPDMSTAAYQGFAGDAFSEERAKRWADPSGGYIHAMHRARWGGYHYRISGKGADGAVTYEGGWQNNRQMGMHERFRMVENIFEELDAPGEWFHNQKTCRLYCMPEVGVDPNQARVEVVRLRHLVEFKGSAQDPVKHVSLKGFTYRHAARTFMETKEPLLRSDWAIYRGGAVLLTGTEDISILDSRFDQVGGNAIFVNNYNRRVLIQGCRIHDAGASGVCFVGDPDAVRNPLFEYKETHDLGEIDRTAGPKTNNYPADAVVDDCLIHGIGRVERQSAGVQISMSRRITIRDTSIYDCTRAGINISEGTWGGHLIEGCDVFNTVQETHDHGSFNSWGRDRYWISQHKAVTQPEVKKDPQLPFLDAMETTVIRNSRWRCDHGWDVDLDDGSSNYKIYNNLMLAGGLKLREGYGRKAFNNIHINNGLHPHVWFEESGDSFTRNIVMSAHRPIGQPKGWGKATDLNLFAFEADLKKSQGYGGDESSITGDPMFIDPAAGDFRVKAGSPAFKVGFVNFPMDQFGVKKPSLKAIAKAPMIPVLLEQSRDKLVKKKTKLPMWMGMGLRGLEGEAFSAFGVSQEDGGVQLIQVRRTPVAANYGLKDNDLVQKVNGEKVTTAEEFLNAIEKAGSGAVKINFVRDQQPKEIRY